ncbi:hypothetical protein MZM54_03570 [[Brevibacterium] frigoritolerans]|nr:hypothetical protein [Peribacillus frigoritolerans]
MANPLFTPLTFPFYDKDRIIGNLTIDVDARGEYIFELDIINESHLPWGFRNSEEKFISKDIDLNLHRKIITNWIEERVFPPERHNADELLAEIGLTEYDLVAVLKSTKARSRYDNFWIEFEK